MRSQMILCLSVAFAATAPSFAMSPDDFYCMGELPVMKQPGEVGKGKYADEFNALPAGPMYFETAVKSCDGKGNQFNGLCQQNVLCGVLTKSEKQKLFNNYKAKLVASHRGQVDLGSLPKSFEEIPEKDQKRLLAPKLEWHYAQVTCPALAGPDSEGTATCPLPKNCKGDLAFKPAPAMPDMEAIANMGLDAAKTGRAPDPVKHDFDDANAKESK